MRSVYVDPLKLTQNCTPPDWTDLLTTQGFSHNVQEDSSAERTRKVVGLSVQVVKTRLAVCLFVIRWPVSNKPTIISPERSGEVNVIFSA